MSFLKNPATLFSDSLEVTYDKRSSFIYGGPSNLIAYTILHGFFTVLAMKELVSILRSLVKGYGKKIRFNRILLWHMVENWEDLFKMIRLCCFPRRMHAFSSQYHGKRVPYNRRAWMRIVLSGIIAFFIFAMDIALISLSTSTTKDYIYVDWDFNGVRTSGTSYVIAFNKLISIQSKSNIVAFEYPPSVNLETERFKHIELGEDFPNFKDVPDPFFRCDTFRYWRQKVTCQINIEGETHLFILRLEANGDMKYHSFSSNISEIESRTEFASKRYKEAIEDQLHIPVTSFVSTEDNFSSERSSAGQCAGYSYLGDNNSTAFDCSPWGVNGADQEAEELACRYEKKDCPRFIQSVSDDCKKRECPQVQSDNTTECEKTCDELSCGYSCSYMGFAMGFNSSVLREQCGTDKVYCYRATAREIFSIFLSSVRIGTREHSDVRYEPYTHSNDLFSTEPRGNVTSQRPILPLYGLILIYILLQLISIILQTTVREHPVCSEMKFLAEVCGGSGVDNLINMNLQDREVIYSQTNSRLDVISGHCGYLPGRIAGDIRQFYSNKNATDDDLMDNTVDNIISESDMDKIIEIDGCIESDEQPNKWKLARKLSQIPPINLFTTFKMHPLAP